MLLPADKLLNLNPPLGCEDQLMSVLWHSLGRGALERAMSGQSVGQVCALDDVLLSSVFNSLISLTPFPKTAVSPNTSFGSQQCVFQCKMDVVLRACAKLDAKSELGKTFYMVCNTNSTKGD